MAERPSNEQRHERICAFNHVWVAWLFVTFCAWAVFVSWKSVDRPISPPTALELPFYILAVVVYTPAFFMILRCFQERFVISIAVVHTAMAVVSWFMPTLFNPVAHLLGRVFLVLWVLAFLMTLSMPVHALRKSPRLKS